MIGMEKQRNREREIKRGSEKGREQKKYMGKSGRNREKGTDRQTIWKEKETERYRKKKYKEMKREKEREREIDIQRQREGEIDRQRESQDI